MTYRNSRIPTLYVIVMCLFIATPKPLESFSVRSTTTTFRRPEERRWVYLDISQSQRCDLIQGSTVAAISRSALCMARAPGGGGGYGSGGGGGGGNRARNNPNIPNNREDRPLMNEEIKAPQLRVLVASTAGEKDEALGILSRNEALTKAREMGDLDLILINAVSDPPVCKIVDYSKYRYSQEKKAKELKKNSKAVEVKEVKMSYKIDTHDYDVRKKNALRFLKQGNRVKCTVMFRGREVQHDKLGFELLERLAEELDEVCAAESRPKREGRNLALILQPRAEVLKALNEERRAEEKAKKLAKLEAKQRLVSAAVANGASVASLNLEDDDEDDDDNYDDDDDDDLTLDDLLGRDEFTESLFR